MGVHARAFRGWPINPVVTRLHTPPLSTSPFGISEFLPSLPSR